MGAFNVIGRRFLCPLVKQPSEEEMPVVPALDELRPCPGAGLLSQAFLTENQQRPNLAFRQDRTAGELDAWLGDEPFCVEYLAVDLFASPLELCRGHRRREL